jgi:hypothetical protein
MMVLPYFQVKDKYIFLHLTNYNKLNDIVFIDKEPSWTFSSKIQGTKASIEAEKLRNKTLNELFKNSLFDDFYKEWIYFKLQGHEDILEDLPFLLYDYGCINRTFQFRKVKQDVEQTLFSDLYYDKDCFYDLALFSKKRLFREQEKVFSTIIDTRDIISIKGELNDFRIEMKNKSLHFSNSITVIDS